MKQDGKEETMEKLIIVAISNYWMRISVLDLLESQELKYLCAESLPDLNTSAEGSAGVIAVVDAFSNKEDLQEMVDQLQGMASVQSVLLLVPDEIFPNLPQWGGRVIPIGYGKILTEILPVLKEELLRPNQLPTLNTKEVNLMGNENGNIFERKVGRRSFLKGSAAAAVVTGVAIANPWDTATQALAVGESANPTSESKELLVSSACRSNCFQSCRLNAHVIDGKVVKTTPASYPDEIYTGSCLKGLSLVQRTYSPTRIKHPMRRVGERGEGQWEVISWDEAITEIADKFMAIQEKYGPKSLALDVGSGNYGLVHGVLGIFNRLINSIGCTKINVCYDQATGHGSDRVIGGSVWLWGNEPRTMMDSKNIIVWGSNPVYSQPQNWRILKEAKKGGAKVITIDPIFSATANQSDEYIPVTPGTDLMLVLAMINYIIEQDLMNIDFMKKRSTATFLVRRDNGLVLRKSDFAPETPDTEDDFYVWDSVANAPALLKDGPQDVAIEGNFNVQGIDVDTTFTLLKNEMKEYTLEKASELTKIPVEKIIELTKTYVDGPTTIYTNYGIDHYQNGHLWSFAVFIMASLTGNIGVKGAGFTGLFVQNIPINYIGMYITNMKMADGNSIPQTEFHKVVRDQAIEGKPYPIKALYTTSSNSMSNWAQQNLWLTDILPNLEFTVVVDTELTDTARYADIVLPAAFWFEVNDLRVNYNNPYIYMQEKAIEPLYESKPDGEIIAMIARKMGLGQFFPENMDDTEWIKVLLDSDKLRAMGITYERLLEEKVVRGTGSAEKPYIRGEQFFNTPSGRAQLYCENPQPRVNYGQNLTGIIEKERMPYYKPPGEASKDNPLFSKYPLVFIQEHSRFRSHTQWFNTPILRELDPEPLAKISREDAKIRGIKTGDIVEVFNDRGKAVLKAEVNDAISTGVISIPKGWQREQFIEGCFQELTNSTSDPMAVNFAYFDCLVDVKKR
ncbi:MAG: molybdopterin-dependent oxidoreductase [Desulfitobacterium sp.]